MMNYPDQTDSVDDETPVEDYLRAHPDFFTRHTQLLAGLTLPHPAQGQVVSLMEHQVLVLREEKRDLERRFREVMTGAADNERMVQRMHHSTLALLAINSLADFASQVARILADGFALGAVAVRVERPLAGNHPLAELTGGGGQPALAPLIERLRHGRSVCDHRLAPETLSDLFGGAAPSVYSCALVPLVFDDQVFGLLGFGASDPQRFNPAMGTVYLDRLGEQVGALLARLLKGYAGD